MKRALLVVLVLLLVWAGKIHFAPIWGLSRRGPGKLPNATLRCLRAADTMVLVSVYPDTRIPVDPGTKLFHDYPVLGETPVSNANTRRCITEVIESSLASWDGSRMLCFEPRHGLRITKGSSAYDLLICFECRAIRTFSGPRNIGSTGIKGSQAALDEILRAANIPLAEAPGELPNVPQSDTRQ